MISIDNLFKQNLILESFKTNTKYVFDIGNLTFADLRDMFIQAFQDDIQVHRCTKDDINTVDCEISPECIKHISECASSKQALNDFINRLEQFIDGIGWRCSINNYVFDKYSRAIINKALQHDLDVSNDSEFIAELVMRLSKLTQKKPTLADLATFAKRDKIDPKCQRYHEFLADLEADSDNMNNQIVKPIQQVIDDALITIAKKMSCLITADPDKKCHKFAFVEIPSDGIDETEVNAYGDNSRLDHYGIFKKQLTKIQQYKFPTNGIKFKYKNAVCKLTWEPSGAYALLKLAN